LRGERAGRHCHFFHQHNKAKLGAAGHTIPRNLRAGGFCILRFAFCISPRPAPFQQRTNTSCYLAIPTHGFTVVLSVFWGTPPAKPLKCKSVSNRLGARFRQRWTESTGRKPRLSCPSSVVALSRRRMDASIRLVLSDIIKTSFSFYSQCSAFRYQVSLLFRFRMGKQKTLLPFR